MKTNIREVLAIALVAGLPALAQAGTFHFPVGLTYANGIHEAADTIFDFYEKAGYDIQDRVEIPLGLTFNPYYEFDNGLGIGLGVGPTAFIVINEDTYGAGYHSEDTRVSYIIPIGADVRYTFLRDRDVSPYVRVGFRYPIAGGDNVDSSRIGPFGAAGVEFWRNKKVGMGIEVGYDGSEVTLEGPGGQKDDVTFSGFNVSISVLF